MNRHSSLIPVKRASMVIQAAILAASALLPAVLLSGSAQGAQLTSRYIDLSSVQSSGADSTEGSGRDGADTAGQDVTYTVGFTTDAVGDYNIGGVVIDFCEESPITGDTCTAPIGFNSNFATLGIANQTGIADFAVDTTNSDANTVILTRTAASVTAGTAVEVDLGTTAITDGFTNPTDLDSVTGGIQSTGTFYARILTYPVTATAQAYTSGTPGAFEDDGGIAMAIANELTVTARVQEVLEFCIGTDTDSSLANVTGDSCADVAGTNLDLGVVGANSIQKTSDGDILNDGVMMIRTNALNGATVYYKAEQEAGLSNGGEGTLRQATLDDCGTILAVNNVCFNSAGGGGANPTLATITLGTELFGMTLRDLNTTSGGATTAVTCDPNYRAAASCDTTAATDYAWDPTGAFDTIASASGPIDDEKASIEFAATASPTTPTGLYTVTANFVATSTF